MEMLRVLVVDDELWIRDSVVRALEPFTVDIPDLGVQVGFEMSEAETGEEALERLRGKPPHIILLDLKLPGISGLDVLEEASREFPETLTVMISAYASIETAVRATKVGAYDFLAKPFTPEELEHVMRKAARHIVVAERARRLARERQQIRFQFISVLAHELKAPLNAVEGFLDVVIKRNAGEDPAVYEEMLSRSRERIRNMRKLILDLLDLTRIESGQKKRELAQVDLLDVVQNALDAVAPEAVQRGITMSFEAEDCARMFADEDEIEIVVHNLLSNAIKYNKEQGRVTVKLRRRGDEVCLEVGDTGIGMTAEEAGNLFKSFVRIKNEKTFGIPGSGLGLSIVKKIAQLYHGEVHVTGEAGVGSTFTVTLMDAAPTPSESGRPPGPAARE